MTRTTKVTAVLVYYITTLLIVASTAAPLVAAEATKPMSETAGAATEPPPKLIDLSNPDEALNPETYLKIIEVGKEWLLNHGPSIIVAIIILIVGRWLARWFSSLARKGMTKGKIEETLASFLSKLIYYALLAAVVIAAADQAGIRTTSFVAIFGAAGLAIGLALKDSLSNFASGVMLILFRPFKVADVVNAGGVSGKVQQIDIFSTIILTADNQRIIVPNSKITTSIITNVNAEATRRIDLTVGIGYTDDIVKAKDVLKELLQAEEHILSDPAPTVAVSELADSSVNLVVRPWVKTQDYWDVRFVLTEKIKLTFDEHGITIPYPQRDLHLHQIPEK